jgi:hypothetical protein
MIKIIEQLLNLEQHTVYLLTKIKIPEEFHKECTIWINYFTKTCLYEVKKYFNDNFTENNNNNNTNNTFLTNKNNNNNTKDFYNQLNYSINILIISIIIAFWRTDINNIDLNININNYESIIKDLSEIMIIHHKIYLLLCYNLLLENKINDDNNLFLVRQIKANLPQKISIGDNRNKILYLEEEIKSCNKIFFKKLKLLLSIVENNKNKNNPLLNEININNLFLLNISKLINLFKK